MNMNERLSNWKAKAIGLTNRSTLRGATFNAFCIAMTINYVPQAVSGQTTIGYLSDGFIAAGGALNIADEATNAIADPETPHFQAAVDSVSATFNDIESLPSLTASFVGSPTHRLGDYTDQAGAQARAQRITNVLGDDASLRVERHEGNWRVNSYNGSEDICERITIGTCQPYA